MLFRRGVAFAPDDEGAGGGGDGGGAAPEWVNALPDTLKGNADIAAFKDPAALAESFVALKGSALVLPGDDAKPEDKAKALGAIFDKLGRPKDAAGYVFPEVKDRPYSESDKTLQAAFAPLAHQLGLSQAQVAGVAQFQNALVAKQIEAATKAAGDTEAALRAQYGDKFDEKLEKGNRALVATLTAAKIDVDAFRKMQLADGSYLGDSKQALGLWIALGEIITEGSYVGGDGGRPKAETPSLASQAYPSMKPKE